MYKIAILGPESTGKSELAKELGEHYHSPWIAEFAREYGEQLNEPYTFEDVNTIAKKQIELENKYENSIENEFVFFDTDLIITKVWFEYCYSSVPQFVIDKLNSKYFDLYLLCTPDLPWVADTVREHGDDRAYFFECYKKEIENLGSPYSIVSGKNKERLENAINGITSFINK